MALIKDSTAEQANAYQSSFELKKAYISITDDTIELDELSKLPDSMYDINRDGETIGRVSNRNGNILINIKKDIEITLTGDVEVNKLFVKSKGSVVLMTLQQTMNDLIIQSDKLIRLSVKLAVKNKIELSADKIENNFELYVNIIKIAAKSEFVNNGLIKAESGVIKSKLVKQYRTLKTNKKIKIYCGDFISSSMSITQSENKFIFFGEQVTAYGCFTAKGLAFFSAKAIQIYKQFNLPACTYLHAVSLHLKNNSYFNLEGQIENAAVVIDKELSIDSGSSLHSVDAAITASVIKNTGYFKALQGPVRANQFNNQGFASFIDANVEIKYRMIGEGVSRYHLENTDLSCKSIETDGTGSFMYFLGTVKTETAELKSKTILVNMSWTTDFLEQGFTGIYRHANITCNKSYQVLPNANLTTRKTTLSGESFHCNGDALLKKSSVDVLQGIRVSGKLLLNRSDMSAETIVATKDSIFESKIESAIYTKKALRIDGKNTITSSLLRGYEITMGVSTIRDTNIKAKKSISIAYVIGSHVCMKAPVIDHFSTHEFTESMIITTLHSQAGEGNIMRSSLKSRFNSIEKNATVLLVDSNLRSELLSSSGDVSLENVRAKISDLTLRKGKLTTKGKTSVKIKESALTASHSKMNLTDSKVTIKNGLFAGKITASKTKLSSKNLVMTNTNTLTEATVSAKNSLIINGKHTANHSTLSGKNVTVSGRLTLENGSHLQARHSLTLQPGSMVQAQDSYLKSQKTMRLFGEVSADHCDFLANDITSYHKLRARQRSSIIAKNSLSLEVDSETNVDASLIRANNAVISGKLIASKSAMIAKGDITFDSFAKTTANGLYVNAGGYLHFSPLSTTTGDSLSAKADILINEGVIDTDKQLALDANYVVNLGGKLGSHGNTSITAARVLSNVGGSIYGNNTQINALGVVNVSGDICGQDNLTINSLVGFNMGLYRSCNANINSLIDMNLGVILPTMPSSIEAVFTPQHLLSVGRLLSTTLLPGKAKLIDFAFRAAPIAYHGIKSCVNLGREVYSIAKSDSRHMSELLPNIPTLDELAETIQTKRLVDYMAPLMAARNLTLSATGLFQSAGNLSTGDFSFNDVGTSFHKPSLSTLANIPLTAFGSTYTSTSLIDVNLGVVASQNSAQTDVIYLNTGIAYSLQSNVHNSTIISNHGFYAANQMILTGAGLYNDGIISGCERLYANIGAINNQGDGRIQTNNADVHVGRLSNNASMKVDSGVISVADSLEVGSNGTTVINNAKVTASSMANSGDYTARSSETNIRQTLSNQGHYCQAGSVTSMSNLSNSGIYTAENSRTEANGQVLNQGHLNQKESSLSAASLTNEGVFTSDKCATEVKDGLVNTGLFTQTDAYVEARQLTNSGAYTVLRGFTEVKGEAVNEGSQTQSESYFKAASLTNKGDFTTTKSEVEVGGALVNQGRLNQADTHIKAEQLDNIGTFAATRSATQVLDDVANKGNFSQSGSSLNANNLSNEGLFTSSESATVIQGNVQNNGELDQSDSYLNAGQLTNAGYYSAERSSTEVNENVQNQGHLTQADSTFNAASLINKGSFTSADSVTEILRDLVNEGEIKQADAYIEAEQLSNTGNYAAERTCTNIRDQIENKGRIVQTESLMMASRLENAGRLDQVDSTIKANSFNNSGVSTAVASATEIEAKLTNQGELGQVESSISADHLLNTGAFSAEKSTTNIQNAFINQGQLNQAETHIHAGSFTNEGVADMHVVSVQVEKDFVQTESGRMIAEATIIESNDQSLDGHFKSANAVFQAEQSTEVKDSATIVNIGHTRISGENVIFDATVDNHSTLAIVAEQNITMMKETHISGENGDLYVSANSASIQGDIQQSNITVEVSQMAHARDFATGNGEGEKIQATDQFYFKVDKPLDLSKSNQRIGSVAIVASDIKVTANQEVEGSYYLEAVSGDVSVDADVHSGNNLTVTAQRNIANNQHDIAAGQDATIHAGDSISNNQGSIASERNTFIVAEGGHVQNTGGMMLGNNHVEVVSKTGITNEVVEHDVRAKHDMIKDYQKAAIIGGAGEGFEGNGAVLITDGVVTNDASTIAATGNVGVSAKEGIESNARVHVYLADQYTKTSGLFRSNKTHVKIYDTQVEKAFICSYGGAVTLLSQYGGMRSIATDIISEDGTTIVADKQIALYDVVAQRKTVKNESGYWGLTHDDKRWRDEFSVPTTLYSISANGISIYSTHDDIYSRGTIIYTPGQFYAEAQNITMTVSKLRHEYSRDVAGFDLSIFGQTVLNSNAPRHNIQLANSETIINHIDELRKSNGGFELALNAMNASTSLANGANSITQGVRNGDLLKEVLNHFGVGNIEPKITLTYTKQHEESMYYTIGAGSLTAGSAILNARYGDITFEGLPVFVATDMKVTANTFTQRGVDLESQHRQESTSVGVELSGKTRLPADVSAQHSSSDETRHDFANQQVHVGNNLDVNAKVWRQDGANAVVGSLSGHVDVHEIVSHTSSLHATSSSASVATTGEFSYSENRTNASVVAQTAGVHIEGVNTNEPTSFNAGTLHTVGGVIDGAGNTKYHADQVIAEDVKESISSSGISISGNINDLIPTQHPSHIIYASGNEGRQIQTVNIGLTNSNYHAIQHPTVELNNGANFSADSVTGRLEADLTKSKEITKNETHHYNAEVPVYNQETLSQMHDNANWLGSRLTGHTYQPSISLNKAISAHMHFDTPEDVAKYAEKVLNMAAMSNAVYGNDTIPDGFHAVGAGYIHAESAVKVMAYVNEQTGELVFSFRGTENLTNLFRPDIDIALGESPRSFDSETRKYIESTMNKFPGYKVSFTGHSLGAANAALASDYYHCPAYVFDNPGIYNPNHQYDFSEVTSFQSTGNLVNHSGQLTGREFDQGKVVQLSSTDAQRLIAAGAQYLGAGGAVASSTYNHKLVEINKELDNYLEDQLKRASTYTQSGSGTFFRPASSNESHSPKKSENNMPIHSKAVQVNSVRSTQVTDSTGVTATLNSFLSTISWLFTSGLESQIQLLHRQIEAAQSQLHDEMARTAELMNEADQVIEDIAQIQEETEQMSQTIRREIAPTQEQTLTTIGQLSRPKCVPTATFFSVRKDVITQEEVDEKTTEVQACVTSLHQSQDVAIALHVKQMKNINSTKRLS